MSILLISLSNICVKLLTSILISANEQKTLPNSYRLYKRRNK